MKFIWFVAFVCVCVSMSVCAHVPQYACEGQKTACRSQLFPSPMRVPGLKLTLDDKLIYGLSHLTGPGKRVIYT